MLRLRERRRWTRCYKPSSEVLRKYEEHIRNIGRINAFKLKKQKSVALER